MTAFSNAILDQVADPTRDICYELLCNSVSTTCLARDYLTVRPEEADMIARCLASYSEPSILDLGACVGRHSLYARGLRPRAKISMVERDTQLLRHCKQTIRPDAAYADFSEVGDSLGFDLIFMLGLGLGIFGNEERTRRGLADVLTRLKPGGSLLIEGGKSTPGEFTTQTFAIQYGSQLDPPLNWGYATIDWLQENLKFIGGTQVASRCGTSHGDQYFICQIKKSD